MRQCDFNGYLRSGSITFRQRGLSILSTARRAGRSSSGIGEKLSGSKEIDEGKNAHLMERNGIHVKSLLK